jgi:phosphatidylinositol-3-phosphatase
VLDASLTFGGYSEDLPSVGSTVCTSGAYARKHAPWVNFTNIPTSTNLPYSYFPTDYSTLPTVSFVIPNLDDDMHDGNYPTELSAEDILLRARLADMSDATVPGRKN